MKTNVKYRVPFSGFLAWQTAILMKDSFMKSTFSFPAKRTSLEAIQSSLRDRVIDMLFETGPCMVWILDLYTKQYEFVSPNVERWLGYEPEKFMQGGLAFTQSLIHSGDLSTIEQALAKVHRLTEIEGKLPKEPVPSNYAFRMKKADGSYVTLFEQSIALKAGCNGVVTHRLSMSFDSQGWQTELGMAAIKDVVDQPATAFPDWLSTDLYPSDKLSIREREVAQLVAKGYSSRQIAEMLCISMHTVNTHRKKIKGKRLQGSTIGQC